MFFKNMKIFKLTRDVAFSSKMEIEFSKFTYAPCSAMDLVKQGFVPPIPGAQPLFLEYGDHVLMAHTKEEKVIPPQALKVRAMERIAEFESLSGRKCSKKEKMQIFEDEISLMAQKAFSRFKTTYVWIDNSAGRVIIDTQSSKVADDILSLIRKALGSMPAVPLAVDNPPEITMTGWLLSESAPDGFSFGDSATLESALEHGGRITAKEQELLSDEIKQHLTSDKLVTSLALNYRGELSFKVTDDLTVKGMKYDSSITDQSDDRETMADRFDADFVVMIEVLGRLIDSLVNVFDEKEAR